MFVMSINGLKVASDDMYPVATEEVYMLNGRIYEDFNFMYSAVSVAEINPYILSFPLIAVSTSDIGFT